MSNRKTKKDLEGLFDVMVDAMKDALAGTVEKGEDGTERRIPPGAATLSAIRQFLKDNHITADTANHKGVKELADSFDNAPFSGEVVEEEYDHNRRH